MTKELLDSNSPEVIPVVQDQKDRMYSIAEAARRLNLPSTWLYQRTRKHSIPHHKLGKYIRFTDSDLSAILEMCSRGPEKEKSGVIS
jgi:excisionase family DNA binding protein